MPTLKVGPSDTWTQPVEPDLVWSVRDTLGNIAAAIDATGMFTANVTLPADPTTALGAATRQYVDSKAGAITGYLPLVGGTLTGAVTSPAYNVGSSKDTWAPTGIYPDLAFSISDGAGNIAAAVLYDGTFSVANTNIGNAIVTNGLLLPATAPSNPNAAVSKSYVDANATAGGPFLPTAGGTMLGPITLAANPAAAMEAVTKQYADALTAGAGGPYIAASGGNMTGKLGIPDDVGVVSSTQVATNDRNNLIRLVTCSSLTPALLIGPQAGWKMDTTKAQGTLAIGYLTAGGAAGGMTGSENVCIGYFTGRSLTTGSFNTGVGHNSIGLESTGGSITAIGCDAMRDSVTCDNGIALGTSSHRGWDGPRNVAIGPSAMQGGLTAPHAVGTDNIAIGRFVMRANGTSGRPAGTVTASRNIAIGVTTMSGDNLSSASDNVIAGYNAAPLNETGSQNILTGSGVTAALVSGNGNIVSGFGAAKSLTSGSNNIVIAAGNATIDVATAAESGTLRIGANAINTIRATGIDTSTPRLFLDWLAASTSFVSDSAAASGGVAIGQLYRNGSAVQVRVS